MSDWMDAESHADRAFEMYERGMWAEAETELRKALSLNPHQADWHFNLGLTLEAAGRDHEALSSYERAIGLADEQPEPLLAAAVVAMRLNRTEQAVTWLRAALELDHTIEPAHAHLIEAQVRLGQPEEAETSFYIAQYALPEPSALCYAAVAEALLQRQQLERAGWCLREAMRINPTLPRLRARLGNVYAARGDSRRALHLYLRDLRDDPGNVDTLLDYGELLMEFNRLGEASEKFRRVLELEPANVDAHFRLGQIASRTKRHERAMVEFELVLKLDPSYPRIRQALAEVLMARGRHHEARTCLREAMDQVAEQICMDSGGRSAPAGGQAGTSGVVASSSSSSSLPILNPPEIGPTDWWTPSELLHLARLLLRVELNAEGARILEHLGARTDLKSRMQVKVLRQLALARFRLGDRAGGVIASRRILRLDSKCIVAMHNLALAAIEDGRLSVAAGWIRRGLQLDRLDEGLRQLRIRLWIARLTGWAGRWRRRSP